MHITQNNSDLPIIQELKSIFERNNSLMIQDFLEKISIEGSDDHPYYKKKAELDWKKLSG